MQNLLKLDTIILPTERIKSLNLAANIGGETGIEIGVFGLESTFKITGQAAQRAFQYLKNVQPANAPPPALSSASPFIEAVIINGVTVPVSFTIGNETFNVADIEWIDLATDFGADGLGIEMRLANDPVGDTRQFVRETAEEAYNALVALASNQDAVTA